MKFSEFLSEAPKVHSNDRIQLINDLLREIDSGMKLRIQPEMLDEAVDEAVAIMKRIWRGHDGTAITEHIAHLKETLKQVRRSLLPIPTWHRALNEDGIWFTNQMVRDTIGLLEQNQLEVMKTFYFLSNLHEVLLALDGFHRLYSGSVGPDGRMGTNPAEQTFIKATFTKLGIIS